MNLPSEEQVLADMSDLENSITADVRGVRSKAIIAYLDSVTKHAEQAVTQTAHDGERQMIQQLIAGYRVVQNTVSAAWERCHCKPLFA